VIIPIFWSSKTEQKLESVHVETSMYKWLQDDSAQVKNNIQTWLSAIQAQRLQEEKFGFWNSLFDRHDPVFNFNRSVSVFDEMRKHDGQLYMSDSSLKESVDFVRRAVSNFFIKLASKSDSIHVPSPTESLNDIRDSTLFSLLVEAAASTITEVEILHRDQSDQLPSSSDYSHVAMVSKLSSQEVLTLKTLGLSSINYVAGMIAREEMGIVHDHKVYMAALFPQAPEELTPLVTPILLKDPLFCLVESGIILSIFRGVDILVICKSIFILTFVRNIICLLRGTIVAREGRLAGTFLSGKETSDDLSLANFRNLVHWLANSIGFEQVDSMDDKIDYSFLLSLTKALTAPLLRQMILYLFSFHSIIVERPADVSNMAFEYDELVRVLKLKDTENELLSQPFSNPHDSAILNLVGGWCRGLVNHRPTEIACASPLPFKLYPIPQQMQKMIEAAIHVKCKNCKTVPVNPALCLICGELLCCQSFCCSKRDRGECFLHCLR
jgi:hypothetical protein